MRDSQQNIKNFMQAFQQECPETPTIPNEKVRVLRVKLILEELLELAEASGVSILVDGNKVKEENILVESNGELPNLLEIMDAIGDIDVVNTGAATAYGVDLEPIHLNIQESNMSKIWDNKDLDTLSDKSSYIIHDLGDGTSVVKRADGKVVKSPSYKAANMEAVLRKLLIKKKK